MAYELKQRRDPQENQHVVCNTGIILHNLEVFTKHCRLCVSLKGCFKKHTSCKFCSNVSTNLTKLWYNSYSISQWEYTADTPLDSLRMLSFKCLFYSTMQMFLYLAKPNQQPEWIQFSSSVINKNSDAFVVGRIYIPWL